MTSRLISKFRYSAVVFYFFTICFFLLIARDALANEKFSNSKEFNKSHSNNFMSKAFQSTKQLTDLERLVATKMALDIRYFCDNTGQSKLKKNAVSAKQCLQPVTKLPQVLSDMVEGTGIGSVVLFAENLITTKQIIQLTHDLQQAAAQSLSGQPLIISIDQEGGRVARLPHATSFAGNMAIGATYVDHGVSFAAETSEVIAKELSALGINSNYAPVVDVNTNADNPVINTRSFSESPQQVAELGVAAVKGFQQNGVMATLKHFPGHGDTHVDSHLGLPVVAHDLETIQKQDIAPFQWAIKHSSPTMIMTAHIQYPALDDSTVMNNAGEKIIRPATMSRKILTNLLREQMGFEGIIATDALDMAGIAHYFDEVTAVVETFVAGADLAVMPFKIRQVEDIDKFYLFIKEVAQQVQQKIDNKELSLAELTRSIERINRYKTQYCQLPKTSVSTQQSLAEQLVAQPQHLTLEQNLADNAVVELTSKKSNLPVNITEVNRIHLFVLDWQEFRALKQAIVKQWQSLGKVAPQVSATVVAQGDAQLQIQSGVKLAKADLVIATVDTKVASVVSSVVDTGGAEDLLTQITVRESKQNDVGYSLLLRYQLQQAQKQNVPSVLIAKGSPYLLGAYINLTDSTLVTFDDRIYQTTSKLENKSQAYSAGYTTSMAIVFGQQKAKGKLPVTLK